MKAVVKCASVAFVFNDSYYSDYDHYLCECESLVVSTRYEMSVVIVYSLL